MRIRFDNLDKELEMPVGIAVEKALEEAGVEWASKAVAVRVNGHIVDLSSRLTADSNISPILPGSPEALEILRHSTSHVMADAVTRLFRNVKLAIGPPIEDGFYYDFDLPVPISADDLPRIEAEMHRIVAEKLPFERIEMKKTEAVDIMKRAGQPYKVELLQDITDQTATFYKHGDFTDLCRGPHLKSTGQVAHFKLLNVAGSYWRGDETRPMLQRIYGTAFFSKEELDEHLFRLEEARRRDHRKLGKELDLFSIHEESGPGLIMWHPKGAIVRHEIENFWKIQHLLNGYEFAYTPHMAKSTIWKISGHWDFYRDNMYSPMDVEGQEYLIKPMNCPGHILIYKTRVRSYRELPIRWAELGTVYRYERSGVLHGLMRVRGFTQDDAHIFCMESQIESEIHGVINFALSMLRKFGFSQYDVCLSTRPEKFVGTRENWERATDALRMAVEKENLPYRIAEGEGVFYGPKIDIMIKDSLGRAWQCSTVQVDFNLPERFDLTYDGADGRKHRPIMIHRTLLGSMERFFGVLLEHYSGALPFWLAPIQVRVLPISDSSLNYSHEVLEELRQHGIRADLDIRKETINARIREGTLQKIPYLLIVGDREAKTRTVAVRIRGQGDRGARPLSEFIEMVVSEKERR